MSEYEPGTEQNPLPFHPFNRYTKAFNGVAYSPDTGKWHQLPAGLTGESESKERVRQLIRAFKDIWIESDFGPAHIAISDYNLLDSNLEFCRQLTWGALGESVSEEIRAHLGEHDYYREHSRGELWATYFLIQMLLQIPEDQRDMYSEAEDDD